MALDPRSFLFALRAAARSLRRSPTELAIAVSSLAIALGVATAVIAQLDALKNPQTPVRDADRLFTADYILANSSANGYPTFEEMRARLERVPLFDTVLVIGSGHDTYSVAANSGAANATYLERRVVDLLGLRPRLGRLFTADETPASGIVIVTDELWRAEFENQPAIGNATLTFGERVYSIVGVLPRGVGTDPSNRSPADFEANLGPLFFPSRAGDEPEREFLIRTRTSATTAEVRAALLDASGTLSVVLGGGRQRIAPFQIAALQPNPLQLREFHVAMLGAAVFVLIIACANVSALMLARGVAQRRNQALRLALGARLADVLRNVAAEIVVITSLGGFAGVLIGVWSIGVLTAVTPAQLTWMGLVPPQLSVRVFAGTLVAVLVALSLASLIPAWYVTRIAPAEPLKEGSGSTTGRLGRRFQVLVAGELALAMVLVFGASLITKSAGAIVTYDFGYDARPLMQVSASISVLPTAAAAESASRPIMLRSRVRTPTGFRDTMIVRRRTPKISHAQLDMVVHSLRTTAGVRNAAWVTSDAAAGGAMVSDVTHALDSVVFQPRVLNIGAGFFETLGLRLLKGRDFIETDRAGRGAVILEERTAQTLFPAGDAIGRLVRLGNDRSAAQWLPVVGIVQPAIHGLPTFPEVEQPPTIYVSRTRHEGFIPRFVVRAERGVSDVRPAIGRTVRDLMPPRVSVSTSRWLTTYDRTLESRRFIAGIFTTLGLASLVLATAGLFGVLSYTVSQRMREFAVRVALGAQRRNMLRLVFRDGLTMVLGGTGLGAIVGMYAAFVVYEWLWGVYPVDATALIIAEIVLFAVTMAASALPALRATRANPVDIMRAT